MGKCKYALSTAVHDCQLRRMTEPCKGFNKVVEQLQQVVTCYLGTGALAIQGRSEQIALEGQGLPHRYLAHHELKSVMLLSPSSSSSSMFVIEY